MNRALFTASIVCLACATWMFSAGPAATQAGLHVALSEARAAAGDRLPEGMWLSIEHALDVSERVAGSFPAQSKSWAMRAQRWLQAAKGGRDAVADARGEILMRGYRSPISEHLQGYAIYTPKDYDPSKKYPLLVMLHGGSANGNLFLGVVLGNNMSWKEYSKYLWDDFAPRWSPDFIVVAPDGFGHVMWRWMGEQDVLDVIADVQKHYSIDEDRIAFGGLSNGGVGAYNVGLRHAHRFSIVTPIAGAPSWLQYAGGKIPDEQVRAMAPLSGMQLAENAINTDFRYYHGRTDGGPMKPRFVEELTKHIAALSVPFKETWFDAGHDLLYLVHRHGRIYGDLLAPARRKKNPPEVRVQTGDYRASRQHWVTVTRIDGYPQIARVRATVSGGRIDVEAQHVRAFELDLTSAPLSDLQNVRIAVNGQEVCAGPRSKLGNVARIVRQGDGYKAGTPPASVLEKRPGVSGPLTDAYYDAVLHVYGTQDPSATDALKRTADRSAKGSPLWLWRVQQRVLPDTELTDALMKSHHVVLYATPSSHSVLARIQDTLPARVDGDGVTLGAQRFNGRGVGVKFIYPNPLAPERYVIIQAAPTTAGVDSGRQLPDFLPDYVVYDATTTASRPRLNFSSKTAPRAMGYFDDHWQLPVHGPAPEHAVKTTTGTAATIAAPEPEPTPKPMTTAQVARAIQRRVAQFPSYRTQVPHGIWRESPLARWSIQQSPRCLRRLEELGIKAQAYETPLPTPVPTPVEITAPIRGVTLRMTHTDRTLLMSCELAVRLPDIVEVLRSHGVRAIDVMSSYRDRPWASFHTMGLALDISRFVTRRGALHVERDFLKTPYEPTCPPPGSAPENAHDVPEAAQRLRAIACALAATQQLSSVLTPNYNEGHRDHFHLDIRPDDSRTFLR